jgi:signal peptidase I
MKTFRIIAQPLLLAVALALVARGAVRLYSIPSLSMDPTLRVGDHILVTPYHRALPWRGDVVVFRSPANRGELFVKRIVAVPGDLVESRAGRLVICGHAVAEPYVLAQATTGAIPSQIVPADSYFVLGDNRANSFDSREWGILPRAMIVGRARLILWSSGSGTMTPRASAAQISRGASPSVALRFERLLRPID